MGVARGSIDERFRPIVRITLARGDDFLALLDTGFNGALLCNREAAAALGVSPDGTAEFVEVAGGIRQEVGRAWLSIVWPGHVLRVRVYVTAEEPKRHLTKDGEPVALLGAALLAPHLVLLDYGINTVEIQEQ